MFNVFPFPPSEAKLLGGGPMNRTNAANCSLRFLFLNQFCFFVIWSEMEMFKMFQYTDAVIHLASAGMAV
jgi:hypothetical protein